MIHEHASRTDAMQSEGLRFADFAFLGKNALWRYVLGFALVFPLGFLLTAALVALCGASGFDVRVSNFAHPGRLLPLADEALQFALVFASVIAFLPGLWFLLPWLHRRPRQSFLTGHERFSWSRLSLSFATAMAIFLAGLFFVLSRAGAPPALHVESTRYLVFVALGLLLVPLQVFTEEFLFRGYLTQAVGRLTGSLAVRLVVPAAAFVALHLANPEVSHNAPAAIAGYGLVALYLGVLALRGDGLEEAIGFHLANNLFVLLVVGGPVTAVPTAAPLVVEPDLRTVLLVTPILYGCHYILVFALLGGVGALRAGQESRMDAALALSPARQAEPQLAIPPQTKSSEKPVPPAPPAPPAAQSQLARAAGAPALAPGPAPSPAAWKALRERR